MRPHYLLSILLACDHRPIILEPASTGEASTSSTSTGAPTTGEESGETSGAASTGEAVCVPVAEANPGAVDAACAEHPYEQAGCPGNLGKTCEEMLALVASKRGCGEVTLCDYAACMVSLSTLPCGAWPPACEAAFKCTTSSG